MAIVGWTTTASALSLGHNIDSDGTCGLTGTGDQPEVDPKLGPLQDNGGPTQTHALLQDSPAIDAADSEECPTTDQRGAPRPLGIQAGSGSVCDVGAFEFGAEVPEPSQLRGDVDCDGAVTLMDAIFGLHNLALDAALPECAGSPDADCSGNFDVADLVPILQHAAGISISPCPT